MKEQEEIVVSWSQGECRDRDARRYYHSGQRQCKQALVAITARQNVVPSTGKLHSTRCPRYDPVGRAITFRLLPPLTLRHQRHTTFGPLATVADCE